MNTTLPKYFIAIILSLLLFPILFSLSSTFVQSAATHVLINEVQVSGTTPDDEFVELFNPTDSPIVMENWRLTRKTSTGAESTLSSDIDGTIPARGHFLIAPPEYDGATTKDFAYSTISRLAGNNTVLLYSDAGVTLVDKVGMGTAIDVENTAVINPATDGSILRVNDNDTDNNLNDFSTVSVSDPDNTSIISTSTPSPTPSNTPTGSPTPTPSPTPTATATSSPTSTPSPSPTSTATSTPTGTPTSTSSPTPTATATATPLNVATFTFPNMTCRMQIHYLSFGFFKMPFAMMVCTHQS